MAASSGDELNLRLALDVLPLAVSVFDRDLRLIFANRQYQVALDFPASLCEPGTPLEAFFRFNAERGDYGPGDVETQVGERLQAARRFEAHCFERIRPDGRVLEICGTPLATGGFITTYADITARRRAEAALRENQAALEQRVIERTAELSKRERDLSEKTRLLQLTLDNIDQGISFISEKLELEVCNRRLLELLDFPPEFGERGTPFERFMRYNAERGEYGPTDPANVELQVRSRMEAAAARQPHVFLRTRPNGKVIEVQGRPLPDGGFVTTYSDVTERQRSAESLRAEQERFFHVFHSSPDYITISDFATGCMIDVNQGFERISGWQRHQAVGETALALGLWADPSERAAMLERLDREGKIANLEMRIRRCTGEFVTVLGSFSLVSIAGRKMIVSVLRDISERKRMEELLRLQRDRLQTLIDGMPGGVTLFDQDLQLIAYNRRFVELLDFGELIDCNPTPSMEEFARFNAERGEYGPCDPEAVVSSMLERARRPEPHLFERMRPNGVVLEVRGAPLPEGGFVTIYTDITGQREAEREVRRLNESLEARVAERTAALERVNRELKQAMDQLVQSEKLAALGRLVAGVAHELNTPLGTTLTLASAVRHRVDEFKAALAQGPLRRSLLEEFVSGMSEASMLIERNAHRAAAQIRDFKELASDQASMRRRVFRLQHTLAELLSALAPTLKKRGVTVSLDIPEEIELDSYPGPLEQVFENLVSNALLHAFDQRAGGAVRISARLDAPVAVACGAADILIEVSDDGVGMPDAVAKQVFDPFFTTKLGAGGTGLGLYIAYSIVTGVLGGEISLRSAIGAGTNFSLRLPSRAPYRKSEEPAAL